MLRRVLPHSSVHAARHQVSGAVDPVRGGHQCSHLHPGSQSYPPTVPLPNIERRFFPPPRVQLSNFIFNPVMMGWKKIGAPIWLKIKLRIHQVIQDHCTLDKFWRQFSYYLALLQQSIFCPENFPVAVFCVFFEFQQ